MRHVFGTPRTCLSQFSLAEKRLIVSYNSRTSRSYAGPTCAADRGGGQNHPARRRSLRDPDLLNLKLWRRSVRQHDAELPELPRTRSAGNFPYSATSVEPSSSGKRATRSTRPTVTFSSIAVCLLPLPRNRLPQAGLQRAVPRPPAGPERSGWRKHAIHEMRHAGGSFRGQEREQPQDLAI
jgi:hypothetical protein